MRRNTALNVAAIAIITLQMVKAQTNDAASKLYASVAKSVFLIVMKSPNGKLEAQATGFSVDGNRIVTNEHVIRDGLPFLDLGTVRIALSVVATDATNDLAILSPQGEISASPLKLAGDQPAPGTVIYAIGNPEGLEKSISNGIVAGLRNLNGRDLMQISAPISHGSSGGPIFTANGTVVGVTVGTLEGGQNLNFAVPAAAVIRLLKEGGGGSPDVPSLLAKIDKLSQEQSQEKYSNDSDSLYQQLAKEMDGLMSQALQRASGNPQILTLLTDKALDLGSPLAVRASEQLVEVKPDSAGYLRLAKSLKYRYSLESDGKDSSENETLKNAEQAIRTAFRTTRQPTTEMYAELADIVEDRDETEEARKAFAKTYEMATAQRNLSISSDALRGLIRTNDRLQAAGETDRWFQALVKSGAVQPYDWQLQASRLFDRRAYEAAGDSYVQAAQNVWLWIDWCRAAWSYYDVKGAEDKALQSARACITSGAGKKDSDQSLAQSHNIIAATLNSRGVYDEALAHARDAVTIEADNANYQDTLAESFMGLRRFQEAINASKLAIRLSDGKYGYMHFRLGSGYFETENWQYAEQSFEKAAELEPKDDAAAYNVAVCMSKLGFYRDAANWYEEVLRRNPNHHKRNDILQRIQNLRR